MFVNDSDNVSECVEKCTYMQLKQHNLSASVMRDNQTNKSFCSKSDFKCNWKCKQFIIRFELLWVIVLLDSYAFKMRDAIENTEIAQNSHM